MRVVFSLTFWKLEYSQEIIGDRDLGISLKTWAQFPEEHAISISSPYSPGVFWEGFQYFHSSPENVQTCAHARAIWVKLRLQRAVRWSKRKFGGYSLTWKLWQQDMGALIRSRCCMWPWQTVTQKSVTLPWGPPCTLPPRPSGQPSARDDWCLPHSPNVASIAPSPPAGTACPWELWPHCPSTVFLPSSCLSAEDAALCQNGTGLVNTPFSDGCSW